MLCRSRLAHLRETGEKDLRNRDGREMEKEKELEVRREVGV